ncbi:MAG: CopG family transcriptional regulator [Calditrichaeota bacterium]|nr:MAG: CopG family transcriptional regulator [Calditrichota bacterium]
MRNKKKKTVKYTDETMGKIEVVSDFLPSPDQLGFKEETVKVTIALSKSSVDYFKKQAQV